MHRFRLLLIAAAAIAALHIAGCDKPSGQDETWTVPPVPPPVAPPPPEVFQSPVPQTNPEEVPPGVEMLEEINGPQTPFEHISFDGSGKPSMLSGMVVRVANLPVVKVDLALDKGEAYMLRNQRPKTGNWQARTELVVTARFTSDNPVNTILVVTDSGGQELRAYSFDGGRAAGWQRLVFRIPELKNAKGAGLSGPVTSYRFEFVRPDDFSRAPKSENTVYLRNVYLK